VDVNLLGDATLIGVKVEAKSGKIKKRTTDASGIEQQELGPAGPSVLARETRHKRSSLPRQTGTRRCNYHWQQSLREQRPISEMASDATARTLLAGQTKHEVIGKCAVLYAKKGL
jgi:hypothetical protein